MKKVLAVLILLASPAFSQDYAVLLNDPPVAQKAAPRSSAGRKLQEAIRQSQSSVIAELKRRKIQVTGSNQVLVNAVYVVADRATAAQLRSIPGVRAVVPAPPLKMDLDRALNLNNVPAAWSSLGGASNAGAGIKIGIIDSGIDQNHPGFQDTSIKPPAGFPKGDANYTNNKVIVARSYVALDSVGFPYDPAGTTHPDDNSPRYRFGHGTGIAMIAAGAQNNNIQGVAPKAFLGNYKIIGSPSVNPYARVVAFQQALEDALNDGMDVVTMSLSEGNPTTYYGPLDIDQQACGGSCDVYAQAIENAVASGMVVVTSAGNDGNINNGQPTLNTIHDPGITPSAITVGATTNSHVLYQAVRAGGQTIKALFGDGPRANVGPVPLFDTGGLACSPLTS